MNGILQRTDWEEAIKMPIGLIPAGKTILTTTLPQENSESHRTGLVLSCVQVQEMAWLNHSCMLPVRNALFQMLYLPLSEVISLFLSFSCTEVHESCGFPGENLMEHKLLVIHRSQAVLGCLYHFARGEEIF